MRIDRIAELRELVKQHARADFDSHVYLLGIDELTEMLDAVEARHNLPPRTEPIQSFTAWLCELEMISGQAYCAEDIGRFRENGYRHGLSPRAALDAEPTWGDM